MNCLSQSRRERGPCFPETGRFRNLKSIVDNYVECKRARAAEELRAFEKMPNLYRAIKQAALARKPDNGKFDHQRRIPRAVLRAWKDALLRRTSSMRSCRAFEALIAILEVESDGIFGIGELTVYDTALRIGAYRRLEPKEVFLHAGTRKGARALGMDGSRASLLPGELPKAFRRLKPREIEDCLCIYKDYLKRERTRL